ncbi:uncharacterized protein DUF2878 [Chromohalobacter marismortui]|uniref:Uncharacterized protein DUF2878 n=1 Tax=Chromohalobacter marismortui TaxID=42055 RepID=A0A4R7NF20_9GAMM|nr:MULTISPECIES: DUF2878 domain-containing protein [Chromohalobacter]MCI0511087.1 DUF2878 domain-containing protein [Chromohalobacter sp.]MCI0593191.1 DUF2878 domain-containing protein [Chromohalobacter sp.]TDU19114.1 uncharacterized protein DUF2878 [Chromohalobacter marismortui]
MLGKIVNALAFQAGWLACVLGGTPWAIPAAGVIVVGHLRWLGGPGEWRWLAGFALLGAIVDGTLTLLGGLRFAGGSGLPIWLWLLWPLFATTIHHSLAWLWRHPRLAILGGALGGPSSYLGGARLADVVMAPWAVVVQAVIWGSLCGYLAFRKTTCRHRA